MANLSGEPATEVLVVAEGSVGAASSSVDAAAGPRVPEPASGMTPVTSVCATDAAVRRDWAVAHSGLF